MKLDTDRIVALTAVLISVCTAVLTLYQTKLMRESAHASVMPYLSITIRSDVNGVYLMLNNTGIGPALIDDIRIRHKGKDLAGDPYQFVVNERPDLVEKQLAVDKITPGRLIPAGAAVQMVGTDGPDRALMVKALLQMFELIDAPKRWLENVDAVGGDKAIVEISYSSVYGDRWRIRSNESVPAIP
jgi:hypothetical protein